MAQTSNHEIVDASGPPAVAQAGVLIGEYLDGVPAALLNFVSVEDELNGLPGDYAPPRGALLLLRERSAPGTAAGCVALRPLPGPGDCEVRRLFVRPAFTGRGLGRYLAEAALRRAEALGYRRVIVETHDSLASANRMLEGFGLTPIRDYFPNPAPGLRSMAVTLASRPRTAVPDEAVLQQLLAPQGCGG